MTNAMCVYDSDPMLVFCIRAHESSIRLTPTPSSIDDDVHSIVPATPDR